MKIVLTADVENVGKAGDIVNVKSGYGRNYLIKQKLGVPGTKENIRKAEAHKARLAKERAEAHQAAVELAQQIDADQIGRASCRERV